MRHLKENIWLQTLAAEWKGFKNSNKWITIILSVPLLFHILVLERYRNGFVEFDEHILSFVLLLISISLMAQLSLSASRYNTINLDALSIVGIIFLSYLLFRVLVIDHSSIQRIILPTSLLYLFLLYRNKWNETNQLVNYFTFAVLLVAFLNLGIFN